MNLVEEDTYVDLAVTELLRNYPLSEEEAYIIAEDFLARNIKRGIPINDPVGDAREYDHELLYNDWTNIYG